MPLNEFTYTEIQQAARDTMRTLRRANRKPKRAVHLRYWRLVSPNRDDLTLRVYYSIENGDITFSNVAL